MPAPSFRVQSRRLPPPFPEPARANTIASPLFRVHEVVELEHPRGLTRSFELSCSALQKDVKTSHQILRDCVVPSCSGAGSLLPTR